MTRAARYRLAFVAGAILLLELLCRTGVIDRLTSFGASTASGIIIWH